VREREARSMREKSCCCCRCCTDDEEEKQRDRHRCPTPGSLLLARPVARSLASGTLQ